MLAEYLPKPAPPSLQRVANLAPVDLDDQELREKMLASKPGEKIRRLEDGDWSGYSSQSEADLALLSHYAFWTDRDADRMTAWFRSSGLYREEGPQKPKGSGYLARTIETAISATTEGFQPFARKRVPTHADVRTTLTVYAGLVETNRAGLRGDLESATPSIRQRNLRLTLRADDRCALGDSVARD